MFERFKILGTLAAVMILWCVVPVAAQQDALQQQDELRQRFGVFGDLGLNIYSADMQSLPGVPCCAPVFTSGSGIGPAFGLLYEFPVAADLMLMLRAGYSSQSGTLANDEPQTVEIQGEAVPIVVEHRIDASLGSIGLAPLAGWRVAPRLMLMGGAEVGLVIASSYQQREQLSDDEPRGTFDNGRRVRNESEGDLPEASSIIASIVAGASYEVKLNEQGTFLAAPEILFSYALTPVVSGRSWSAHALRAGIALKYSPLPSPAPPPPVVPPVLAASVTAHGIGADGGEVPSAQLRVEEFIAADVRPLLGYLFFDENSATIPARYNMIAASDAGRFSIDAHHRSGTLEVYHDLLNIVGRRMRDNPSATLTLVGTNAGVNIESGGRTLSTERAEVVKRYLHESWGIAESRLRIEARDLPSVPSNTTHAEGIAENRRVELHSTDASILAPVRTFDTLRQTTPPVIVFRTSVRAEAGVASWNMQALQDGHLLREFSGSGDVPLELTWQVTDEQGSVPRAPGELEYRLTVVDRSGQRHQSPAGRLPVEQVTMRSKQQNQLSDASIERYGLILFDFDRSEMNREHRQLIEEIRTRITPSSRVTIVGYADQTGDAARNRQLALERAQSVGAALNLEPSQLEVRGETTPLYDQSLPEGRFNSRTVTITVSVPIDEARRELE